MGKAPTHKTRASHFPHSNRTKKIHGILYSKPLQSRGSFHLHFIYGRQQLHLDEFFAFSRGKFTNILSLVIQYTHLDDLNLAKKFVKSSIGIRVVTTMHPKEILPFLPFSAPI